MIQGFFEQTAPLTDYELNILVPVVARKLTPRKGKSCSITNSIICSELCDNGYKVDCARLRKIISHIRVNGIVPNLIATNSGYYIAESRDELCEYMKSLEHRESAIHAVRVSLAKQMLLL